MIAGRTKRTTKRALRGGRGGEVVRTLGWAFCPLEDPLYQAARPGVTNAGLKASLAGKDVFIDPQCFSFCWFSLSQHVHI